MIRTLVVDDSAFMRRAIRRMLEADPQITVVGCASGGREGLELVERERPDVVTLDVEMPDIDGLTVLRRIMAERPTPVLMLSSLTTRGSHTALQALKLGAADVLAKDASYVSLSIGEIEAELRARVKAIARQRGTDAVVPKPASTDREMPRLRATGLDAVVIGSSTGGPPVLERLIHALPAGFRVPVVVAQHMPAVFTKSLAERLDGICAVRVMHAEDGMALERGTVYIAPGGLLTGIRKRGVARWVMSVREDDGSHLYKPSVDYLFASAAEAMRRRVLGIVLTGMGEDGRIGAGALREQGGAILSQESASCVVYGMPRAVDKAGLSQASGTPDELAAYLSGLDESPGVSASAA